MNRLLAGGVMGSVIGAGAVVANMGILPPVVNMFLWPGLIAGLFLVLSIWFAIKGPRIWLWPCAIGFLVQAVGLLLIWSGEEGQYWKTIIYTVVGVAAALLIMLLVWLVGWFRAKWMERKIRDGVGDIEGVDPAKLRELRENVQETLTRLRRMGGRRAVYTLPWQLVTGRSGVGKTVAIKKSGLGLPARKDRVKGVGGTSTCDYFFTKDVIFLDTPGGWVEEGADDEARDIWLEQVRLLKRFRPGRPLDGIVVAVSGDDLLGQSRQELEEQASNIREVIDLLQDELRFRFPVYLLISKCDLVEGFVQFFKGLPAQRKHEILGWSNEDPNRRNVRALILEGFERVSKRLAAYRLEILARTASLSAAKRLFFFTEEFKRLRQPLAAFADALFERDLEHEPPIFRGFYFTSGTQGEGTILGQEMDEMRKRLGIPPSRPSPVEEEEPRRGYFLLDLFRRVVVGDEGLLSRSTFHWLKRRRHTLLGAFLPAAVALILLLISFVMFVRYDALYDRIKTDVPRIVADLQNCPNSYGVLDCLERTEKLRSYHRKLTGFNFVPRMGMRQPGGLAPEVLRIYQEQFNDKVLRPSLEAAEVFVSNPENTCTDRAEVLYGVLWLREGNLAEWSDDLEGFTRTWRVAGQRDEEQLRDGLRRQFTYLMKQLPDEQRLLPGIDLATAASHLQEKCGEGLTTALEQYRSFQQQCADPPIAEVKNCFRLLNDAARSGEEDYPRLTRYLDSIEQGLKRLGGKERGATEAYAVWKGFQMPQEKSNDCLAEFEEKIVSKIRDYADQDDLVGECRRKYEDGGRSKKAVLAEVLGEQEKALEEKQTDLRNELNSFGDRCGTALGEKFEVRPEVLFGLAASYRREACRDFPVKAVDGKGQRIPPPEPRAVEYDFFVSPPVVNGSYREAGLKYQIDPVWQGELDLIATMTETQKREAQQALDGKIRGYGRNYGKNWRGYLEALELKTPATSVPEWIAALSKSTEFHDVLHFATGAVLRLQAYSDTPFALMVPGVETLKGIPAFEQGQLGAYQQHHLSLVAADLASCARNNLSWNDYKAKVRRSSPENSLIAAERWVEMQAGPSLAGGVLRELLFDPLAEARDWVMSPDLIRRQWNDLRQSFTEARAKFPLDRSGTELIESATFQGLFGRKTGQVFVFHRENSLGDLRAEQRDWLEQVTGLSSIFFQDDTDGLHALVLSVSWGDTTYEPEKKLGDYELRAVVLNLGDKEIEVPRSPREESVELNLLDLAITTSSFVEVTIAKKKGLMGRTLGKNWIEEKKIILETRDGWAPLGLLKDGLPEGAPVAGDKLTLEYSIDIQPKPNKPPIGVVTAELVVEGKDLGAFLRLMESGFPAPPTTDMQD